MQAIKIKVHHRCRVKGQQLADKQAAQDGDPKRLAQLNACTTGEYERQRPEEGMR